ncbi:hypothetical protein FH972_022965 [Carpinus fangiana]|uniref:Uncharacterized protein n=1 Tax=Carpinus fangiana TaxID=176857 RepID=A0A5N6KTT1_9ROSI|nr:hypothetical protein FH972_022965 [Carpinus fangiana]
MPSSGIAGMGMQPLHQLPLVKLSSAVTEDMTTKPVPWIHQTDPDMTFVIDSMPGQDVETTAFLQSNRKMKIYRGRQLLEMLPIEEMCHASQMTEADARSRGRTLQHTDYPTAAIVKSPCVALRYCLEDGQIRRLQFKFATDNDFETVFTFLKSLHCPIASSIPKPPDVAAPRPQSALPNMQTSQVGTPHPSQHTRSMHLPPSFQSSSDAKVHGLPISQPMSRPTTAPSATSGSLEAIMPPRRTLPFIDRTTSNDTTNLSRMPAVHTGTPTPGSTTETQDRLAEHASKSPAERAAAMNRLIMAHIDNNDFVVFCQDYENAWRRIGL